MFSFFRKSEPANALKTGSICLLQIGTGPGDLTPADCAGWKSCIDELLRESPDRVVIVSDDPNDLGMVRKALRYLAEIGGEVGVAPQLPTREVAEIFGVDEEMYLLAVQDPGGPAGMM